MKTSLNYALLFAAIQAVNLPLMLLGVPLVALCLALNIELPWLWNNSDDAQLLAQMTKWKRFVYLALRNPVANLRHVPGVSKSGRPIWYWTITVKEREFYAKAGWMSDGYPCLSAGSGRGY